MQRDTRRLSIAATALLTALTITAPASASVIGISGGTLIVIGDPSSDVFTASNSVSDVFISTSIPLTAVTPGCTVTVTGATCPLSGFSLLAILGGDGDDVIDASAVTSLLNVFLSGGGGEDVLIGGAGDDILKGGTGDDVLLGGPGADQLFGGIGADLLLNGTIISEDGDGPPDPVLVTEPTAVPEPATLILVGLGLGTSAAARRRQGGNRRTLL